MAPVLGYWKIRGLAHPLRMLFHYKELEFEDKTYAQGPAPDFSSENWPKEKFSLGLELPNLPYYIDEDVKITETSAIFAYLGRKHKVDGSTEEARIRNDMTYSLAGETYKAFTGICYHQPTSERFEQLMGAYLESLPARLEKFSMWLGDHEYFGGSELVYSDFCVYEMFDILNHLKPGCLDKYENLKTFMTRIEGLPTLKNCMAIDSYMHSLPINSPMARWGVKPF